MYNFFLTTLVVGLVAFSAVLTIPIQISNAAVVTSQIANDAITSPKIKDGEVKTPDLSDNAVTSAKIQNGQVMRDDLADNAVVTEKIQEGAVGTSDLGPAAVTAEKIGFDAVTNAAISPGAVTTDKIASGAVQPLITQRASPDGPDVPPGGDSTITADCIGGELATGGGYLAGNYKLVVSTNTKVTDTQKWLVIGHNTDTVPHGLYAYVMCLKLTP